MIKKKVFEKKFENGSKTILLDLNLMQKKLINLQWSAKGMSLLLSEKKKAWNFIWWKNIWDLEKENGDLKNQMIFFFLTV